MQYPRVKPRESTSLPFKSIRPDHGGRVGEGMGSVTRSVYADLDELIRVPGIRLDYRLS
jgi:hypothetical protein